MAPPEARWTAYLLDCRKDVGRFGQEACRRSLRVPVRWVPTLSEAYRLLVSRSRRNRLWMVAWRMDDATTYGFLTDIREESAIVHTDDARLREQAGMPFVLPTSGRDGMPGGGIAEHADTLLELMANPWMATGASLSMMLARFVPQRDLWRLLTVEDHELLARLAFGGAALSGGDIGALLGLDRAKLKPRLELICRKMGVSHISNAVAAYRVLTASGRASSRIAEARTSGRAASDD